MRSHSSTTLGEIGAVIGIGLLAGIAGTFAITMSQKVEMKIDGRKRGDAPAEAASKVLDVKPLHHQQKEKLANEIHWAYGTSWGIARGIIALSGLKGWKASLLHFGAVWGTALVMLPSLKMAPPPAKERAKLLAIDGFHHAVYAVAAGCAYDAMVGKKQRHPMMAKMKKWKKIAEELKRKVA
ncbi:MAG: hypothetical protein ACOH2A_10435 [Sphingobacteriaceae bacterium]